MAVKASERRYFGRKNIDFIVSKPHRGDISIDNVAPMGL